MMGKDKLRDEYNIDMVSIISIISSILIMIIHNFNFNIYIRDFIIPISIMIIAYLFLINKLEIKINKKAYILLIPIILILLSRVLLPIAFSNMLINIFILPLLISMFFLSLTNNNYNISKNILSWFLELFPKRLFNNMDNISITDKIKGNKRIGNILIGICISIPIVIIILLLLTSADIYFDYFINNILDIFSNIFNIEYLFRNIIYIGIWFIIIFSVFINILINKDKKKDDNTIYDPNKDISITVLSLINLVFVLFLISEVSKLTNNFLKLPLYYTYSSYAREGFFQLLGVTTINFSIILYFLYFTNCIKNNKVIKYLILLLISFSILLIFNSYYRMYLYIARFGFTILRSQVILFLLMELVLFIILIKKILKELKYRDSIIFTIIILVTYILNLYLCNDIIIRFINRML